MLFTGSLLVSKLSNVANSILLITHRPTLAWCPVNSHTVIILIIHLPPHHPTAYNICCMLQKRQFFLIQDLRMKINSLVTNNLYSAVSQLMICHNRPPCLGRHGDSDTEAGDVQAVASATETTNIASRLLSLARSQWCHHPC